MLYLIDDYIAEGLKKSSDQKRFLELLRFKSAEKNLHEMTIEEVNKATSEWAAVSESTAANIRRKFGQYLKWLAQKGISSNFSAADMKMPIKNVEEVDIYSTSDIHKYYDLLKIALERNAASKGESTSLFFYNMCHAAGILAFYGLSDKEILELELSDIQPDGVIGYDLPLTKEDIDVLLRYKYQTKCDNGLNLQGTKYIRTASTKVPADAQFMSRPLILLNVEEEYSFLKTVLKNSYLNLQGKFDRAYRLEKSSKDKLAERGKIPQWFVDTFQVSVNWITKRKKEYLAYRERRDRVCPIDDTSDIEKKNPEKDNTLSRIAAIQRHIDQLNKEVEELRQQLPD